MVPRNINSNTWCSFHQSWQWSSSNLQGKACCAILFPFVRAFSRLGSVHILPCMPGRKYSESSVAIGPRVSCSESIANAAFSLFLVFLFSMQRAEKCNVRYPPWSNSPNYRFAIVIISRFFVVSIVAHSLRPNNYQVCGRSFHVFVVAECTW